MAGSKHARMVRRITYFRRPHAHGFGGSGIDGHYLIFILGTAGSQRIRFRNARALGGQFGLRSQRDGFLGDNYRRYIIVERALGVVSGAHRGRRHIRRGGSRSRPGGSFGIF